MKSINRFIFPFLLVLLTFILLFLNFDSGTFLIGWDNLQTDLSAVINLERALNVSWQEYQGLGLLGGMGHGADLIRQILMIPFSLILDQNLLRYFWNFISLAAGVLGSYSLFLYFTKNRSVSFLGASFYLLNIGTVQNFYVTFEPFSCFFAFLPWLIYSLFKYLDNANAKNLFFFFCFSLMGTSFAYVQTIFLVYLILLIIILFFYFFRKDFVSKREKILNSSKILLVAFAVNAFWLLPVSFFTLTNSAVTTNAKGNLMSTEAVFLRNNKFGNFFDLAQLKGYWFDAADFDQFGNMVFLLDEWKNHFQNPLVMFISFSFFILLVIGVLSLFISRNLSSKLKQSRWLILTLFLFCCFILLGSNPPFGFVYDFLRNNVLLFGQIFRSSFTKWIVPFSLFYSLLLTFGLVFIFSILKKRFLKLVAGLIFFIALIFYSWTSFQGHFFYERLRVKIPEAYFKTFNYFRHEVSASNRIANLPQHSFYGWQWNDWGYRGSGFLWYGIKQPILDRAFDVWSEADERYYWQLQSALDKKDVKMLEDVLSAHDVDYLLLDESVVNRNTIKPFNYQGIKDLLVGSSRVKSVQKFDFISIYSFADQENSREKEFVSLYETLPIINNQHSFAWSDQAFVNFHDYLSEVDNHANNAKIIYPFSSLFTNHLQKDLEFKLDEDESFFYLSSEKNLPKENFEVILSNLLNAETEIPFHLSWTTEGKQTKLIFKALLPEVYFSDQKYYFDFTKEFTLNSQTCQHSNDCYLNINNQILGQFKPSGETNLTLTTKLLNTIALSTNQKNEYFDYAFFNLTDYAWQPKMLKTAGNETLIVKIPKILVQTDILKTKFNNDEAKNCRPLDQGSFFKEKRSDGNYYQAIGTSVCDHFYLEQLKHNASYLFRLDANALRSLPFVFAIQAESLGRSPLETYLSEGVNYQILPPTENFNQGYTLYLSTDSYGREINDNFLRSTEVFVWPYNFLSNLSLQDSKDNVAKAALSTCDFEVAKKALWFYQVDLVDGCQAKYLKLSQAYDKGWLAFRDGKLLQHTKINNWANAWVLDDEIAENHNTVSDGAIYIFFWPQLLEYFGFGLLFVGGCWLWKINKHLH